jgi:hypothetical protein
MRKTLLTTLLLVSFKLFSQPEIIHTLNDPVNAFTPVGNDLYFFLSDMENDSFKGNYLLKTDGTSANADTVKNLEFTAYYSTGGDENYFYFYTISSEGYIIWSSDGSEAGTLPVDTFSGIETYAQFPEAGNIVFFHAKNKEGKPGLYKISGKTVTFLQDVNPDNSPTTIIKNQTFTIGDLLFFYVTERGLYAVNGKTEQVLQVSAVNPDLATAERLFEFNDGIVYVTNEKGVPSTRYISSISSTPVILSESFTELFKSIGTAGYFIVNKPQEDNTFGHFELWKTISGNTPVMVYKFPDGLAPTHMEAVGDQLAIFSAECGSYTSGDEDFFCERLINITLWKSDGTPGGTVAVENVSRESPEDYVNGPHVLNTAFGPRIYFSAGNTLWESDLTPGGTRDFSVVYPSLPAIKGANSIIFRSSYYFDGFEEYPGDPVNIYRYIPEEIITSVKETTNKDAATIQPNPVNESAEITLSEMISGNVNLMITDITGKVIMNSDADCRNGKILIDCSPLIGSSVYFFMVNTPDKIYKGKIMK